jgi:menaquinone-dependent protoporphyrinogen oxidase
MATSVLVGYASTYGSTHEVAEAIGLALRESGLAAEVRPASDVRTLDGYDAVILGAPLIMFRWHKDALNFLSRHRQALQKRPLVIFALGPTHDPHDEQEWRDSWDQLEKALAKFSWLSPVALEMFGGSFDPAKLRFPLNKLAGSEPASDIRDWTAIRNWTIDLAGKLEPASVQA